MTLTPKDMKFLRYWSAITFFGSFLIAGVLVGCKSGVEEVREHVNSQVQEATVGDRVNKLSQYPEVSNIVIQSQGYVHYSIENGSVTCREHFKRHELSCWRSNE